MYPTTSGTLCQPLSQGSPASGPMPTAGSDLEDLRLPRPECRGGPVAVMEPMINRVPRVRAAAVEPVGDSAVVEQGRPRAPAGAPALPGRRWRRQRHRHRRRCPDRAAARSRETAHQSRGASSPGLTDPGLPAAGKPQPPGQVLVAPLAVVGHRVEGAAGSVVEHRSVRPDEGQVEVRSSVVFVCFRTAPGLPGRCRRVVSSPR